METETQIRFGSNAIDLAKFVDALADAIEACGLSLDWAPGGDTIYLGWHAYGESAVWVDCSCGKVARDLAKFVAANLGQELSLYEASCVMTNDTGDLSFQARTISSEGKVSPKASTTLDGENLEAITAGFVRDRLSQLLDLLQCCKAGPGLSHSFKVFTGGSEQLNPSTKATALREKRVQDILDELQRGTSLVLTRLDEATYEFVIQTVAGYRSTIYASVAEKEAFEAALTDELRTKLVVSSVHGPLRKH